MNQDLNGHVEKPTSEAAKDLNLKYAYSLPQNTPSRVYTPRQDMAPTDKDTSIYGDRPMTLPAQLLDDLRKRHNLTPAAAKGSSFSKSIPITDSERHTRDGRESSTDEIISDWPMAEEPLPSIEKLQLSDDESSEEKISSAVFVPHQSREKNRDHDKTSGRSEAIDSASDLREASEEPEEWRLEQHEVHEILPNADEYRRALGSPVKMSPELGIRRARTSSGYFSQSSSGHYESVTGPVSDAGYSTSTKDDESEIEPQEEDMEATPTESNFKQRMASITRKPSEAKVSKMTEKETLTSKAPKEAIELIPYKHQVGGHTTLWRFSRRAVCKQLNNRENEFYETVEHHHPALLKFMPRYDNNRLAGYHGSAIIQIELIGC